MESITLKDIKKCFDKVVAVNDLSLEVKKGELFCLLGPSGCGKTTTLRIIAGFLYPTNGKIFIGDRDVTSDPPFKRDIGMVFQNYALFPHMNVAQNVAFGLRMRKIEKKEIQKKVDEYLEMVGLSPMKNRHPNELSGGQQQRVALIRALIIEPTILLCDEPLSNLDAKMRKQMRIEIKRIQQKFGITTVFVTHDQEEALTIADRIGVMNEGYLEQIGTGEGIYNFPENKFVADFIGTSNIFVGKLLREDADKYFILIDKTKQTKIYLPASCNPKALYDLNNQEEKEVEAVIRPERIKITKLDNAEVKTNENSFFGKIIFKSRLGSNIEYKILLENNFELVVHLLGIEDNLIFEENEKVCVSWNQEHTILLK